MAEEKAEDPGEVKVEVVRAEETEEVVRAEDLAVAMGAAEQVVAMEGVEEEAVMEVAKAVEGKGVGRAAVLAAVAAD